MLYRMSRVGIFVLALVASFATPEAAAQEQESQPVTYIAEWRVKRGMEQAFVDLIDELYAPIFNGLMEGDDPPLLGWGVYESFLHVADGHTHAMWYTMRDMAALDQVEAAAAVIGEMDMAAVEASSSGVPKRPLMAQRIRAIAHVDTHRDLLLRHIVMSRSEETPAAGVKPHYWLFKTKALPGKEREYEELWKTYYQPILQSFIETGTAKGFGLSVQAARVTDEFTHTTWVQFENFAEYQRAMENFLAKQASLDESERAEREAAFQAVTDPEAARTIIGISRTYHSSRTK